MELCDLNVLIRWMRVAAKILLTTPPVTRRDRNARSVEESARPQSEGARPLLYGPLRNRALPEELEAELDSGGCWWWWR